MRGAIGSLNAAVAGSIMLFEAVAQRDPDGEPPPETRAGRRACRVRRRRRPPIEDPETRGSRGRSASRPTTLRRADAPPDEAAADEAGRGRRSRPPEAAPRTSEPLLPEGPGPEPDRA